MCNAYITFKSLFLCNNLLHSSRMWYILEENKKIIQLNVLLRNLSCYFNIFIVSTWWYCLRKFVMLSVIWKSVGVGFCDGFTQYFLSQILNVYLCGFHESRAVSSLKCQHWRIEIVSLWGTLGWRMQSYVNHSSETCMVGYLGASWCDGHLKLLSQHAMSLEAADHVSWKLITLISDDQ